MTSKLALAALLSISTLCAVAQPKAKFHTTEFDLGIVPWHSGATAIVKLSNSGNKPLQITDVQTDCECTVADWSQGPISAGSSTKLSLTFDAQTLGTFSRYISVTTNADAEPVLIHLTGRVQSAEHDFSDEFPIRIDDILLSTGIIEFDDVSQGQHPSATINIMNHSRKDYAPTFMHLPRWLTATAVPEVLTPGRVGQVNFVLNSDELDHVGLTKSTIYLSRFPGDKVRKEAQINVAATLQPHFETSTPDANAGHESSLQPLPSADGPVAAIPHVLQLGPTLGKKKLKGLLYLENQGTLPLHVLSLQVANQGVNVSLSKREIAPGGRAALKVKTSSAINKYRERPRILIITDDPNHSMITVDITAD